MLDGNGGELRRKNIKSTFSAAALPQIRGNRGMRSAISWSMPCNQFLTADN
jgi:hypothetical protein